MAKIGVFSDSHGNIESLNRLLPRIGQVDSVFFLGDIVEDAPRIANRLNSGFVSVRGNCDGWAQEPLEQIVPWLGHRILLLHGHTCSGKLSLVYKAKSESCDIVCYGHSHVPSVETEQGILLLNPGSLSRPRTRLGPSCAVLHLTETDATAELLFADETDSAF